MILMLGKLSNEHPPPVKLRPDEDEGVDPDVQLPLRVGGMKQSDEELLDQNDNDAWWCDWINYLTPTCGASGMSRMQMIAMIMIIMVIESLEWL